MVAVPTQIPDEFGPGPIGVSVLRFLKEHRSCVVWEGKVKLKFIFFILLIHYAQFEWYACTMVHHLHKKEFCTKLCTTVIYLFFLWWSYSDFKDHSILIQVFTHMKRQLIL